MGFTLNPGTVIQPMLILILPPGGFFVFGMLVALFNKIAEGKGKEPATLSCCNCPAADVCRKAAEGGNE
jgi:electron transport complex protein RnfE